MFASLDRGISWTRINGNLPTNSVQAVAIHPLAGEIAVATHGRGVWILDVTHLRQMTAEVLAQGTQLFAPAPAILWGPRGIRRGDLYGGDRFYGENHVDGALIYYSLAGDSEEVSLTVSDAENKILRTLPASAMGEGGNLAGLHRVVWDHRRDRTEAERVAQQRGRGGRGQGGRGRGRGGRGGRGRGGRGRGGGNRPRVGPGIYQLTLTVDGGQIEQTLEVQPDPDGR